TSARLLGTGDAGGIYEVKNGSPKNPSYMSKVLDAEFPAHFGNLRWHGSGKVSFETRSGNTSKPDRSWSAWQSTTQTEHLSDGGLSRVPSPEGRYVQFRS